MTVRTLVSAKIDGTDGHFVSASVLQYWNDAGPKRWFTRDAQFDLEFRTRFLEHHLAAAARRLDAWSLVHPLEMVPKISQKTACSLTMRSNAIIRGTNHSRRMFGIA